VSADRWVALCYHDVAPAAEVAGGGPERFSVPLASFERMLDTIREEGFAGCSLADAMRAPTARRVAITFDDANLGQFVHAVPALRARGMTATIYVVTDWVGREGFMSWDQLRAAADAGISIQSHTRSHPFLSELDAPALREELSRSKERLDRELRQETTEIAFPGGDAPRRGLRSLMRETGYTVAVGSRWGTNPADAVAGRFVRRCTVRGSLTPDDARRYVHADRLFALRMHPREMVLRTLRAALGPSRYAAMRRRFLDGAAWSRTSEAR
jgi:peptidoglycan/xylan/chitin deacetylase (PgdA/CDA1 family)